MEKTLKVTCKAAATLPLEKLVPLQGKLKTLSLREAEKLRESMLKYGIAFPFFVWKDKGTTFILDGHQRDTVLRQMQQEGWTVPPLPIVFIDASSKKEAMEKILLISSKYGQMTQEGLLEFAALGEIKLPDLKDVISIPELDIDKALKDVLKSDSENKEEADENDPRLEADKSIMEFNELAILPSTNKWGIPDLREDMLSTQIPTKVFHYRTPEDIPKEGYSAEDYLFLFGRVRSSVLPYVKGGVLAFYVWDNVFEKIWDNAVSMIHKIREEGWAAVITPNFSMWRDDPLCVQMNQIYRNRWFARYWQEAGIKIIPDLNWGDERSYEFVFNGLPKHIPVASTVWRNVNKGNVDTQKLVKAGMSELLSRVSIDTILCYGEGGDLDLLKSMLPHGPQYVFIPSWMAARKAEVLDKTKTHMYQSSVEKPKRSRKK